MDIKEKIEELVAKITKNSDLLDKFKKNPMDTVKDLVGDKIPEDVLEKIVSGVKAKISVDKLSDAVGSLGKLFKK